MFKLLFCSLFCAFLASCNSSSSGPTTPEPVRPTYEGDLVKLSREVYEPEDSWYLYDCDVKQKQMVLEISAALEKNKENIIALKKQQLAKNSEAKIITLNGFDFIDWPSNEFPDKWEEERYSWTEIYDIYLKIKDDPNNSNWIYVNSAARSLIFEDQYRIEYSYHPSFSLKYKENILRAYKVAEKCFKDESCTSIVLESSDETWLRQGKYHNYIFENMNSSESFERRRKRLVFLYKDMAYGASRYEVSLNDSIKVEGDTLRVPLDLEILGDDAKVVLDLLEKTWAVHGLNLKINNSKDGFKVYISDTPGERAFVNFTKHFMQLYTPGSFLTVEHEFGHVLGLPDSYYTSFDQRTCEYVDEYNSGDMMSAKGKVLPSHIEQIKKTYGL